MSETKAMTQNRAPTAKERLARNTIVYMIGNAGSKVLQMLFLPLITGLLSTADYGYYDLVVTSINLVTPVVTFQISEAMFRNLFYGDDDEKAVVLSSVAAFILGGAIALAIVIGAMVFGGFPVQYPILVFLNYVSSMYFTYVQKVARSEQRNNIVALAGVVNTVSMLAIQAITLLLLNMRADGMLVANCLSYFIAGMVMQRSVGLLRRLSVLKIRGGELRSMIKLSLPLVPNSVCWYFVASGNSYFITILISAAANGVYAIANGFAQMLTFLTGVFQMAWQESSILEASSNEREAFYTATFNSYMRLLFSAYIVLLPLVRFVMPILVAESYQSGYLLIPLLLASSVFAAFSQFYGSAYLAFRKTGGALSTTLVAAIVNCAICIVLIPFIGLFAPALGSAAAFLVQWIMRVRQMRDFFKIEIEYRVFLLLVLCCGGSCLLYYVDSSMLHGIALAGGILIAFIANRKMLKGLLAKVKERIHG